MQTKNQPLQLISRFSFVKTINYLVPMVYLLY
nr:MAG TPA: hypothetical protein [Caudoviricetes sp.]